MKWQLAPNALLHWFIRMIRIVLRKEDVPFPWGNLLSIMRSLSIHYFLIRLRSGTVNGGYMLKASTDVVERKGITFHLGRSANQNIRISAGQRISINESKEIVIRSIFSRRQKRQRKQIRIFFTSSNLLYERECILLLRASQTATEDFSTNNLLQMGTSEIY